MGSTTVIPHKINQNSNQFALIKLGKRKITDESSFSIVLQTLCYPSVNLDPHAELKFTKAIAFTNTSLKVL